MTLLLEHARTYAVPVETAYDVLLPTPLPELFSQRYGVIPPIKRVSGQIGAWGSAGVGATRTIHLADGGSMVETLTSLDRPTGFGYRIGDVKGPMMPLVRSVRGHWGLASDGSGTRVTWTWEVEPRRFAGPLMPVLRQQWNGFAGKAFDRLGEILAA